MALVQAAECQSPEVHVPDFIVDLLKTHIFTRADGGDVDPAAVPANVPIALERTRFARFSPQALVSRLRPAVLPLPS